MNYTKPTTTLINAAQVEIQGNSEDWIVRRWHLGASSLQFYHRSRVRSG